MPKLFMGKVKTGKNNSHKQGVQGEGKNTTNRSGIIYPESDENIPKKETNIT